MLRLQRRRQAFLYNVERQQRTFRAISATSVVVQPSDSAKARASVSLPNRKSM